MHRCPNNVNRQFILYLASTEFVIRLSPCPASSNFSREERTPSKGLFLTLGLFSIGIISQSLILITVCHGYISCIYSFSNLPARLSRIVFMALGFNFNPSNISLLKNKRERKRKFRGFKDARMFPRGNFPEDFSQEEVSQ